MNKKHCVNCSEDVYKGKVVKVVKERIILPHNVETVWETVGLRGGACVVAIDEDRNLYLVRQYRPSVCEELLEIPGGVLENGEDPLECARRELVEELGIIAEKILLINEIYTSPGWSNEKLFIFVAQGLTFGEQSLDIEEDIIIEKYHIDEALKMVLDGKIRDAKTIVGILSARLAIEMEK